MSTTDPYGSWPSPITAEMAVTSGVRFADTIQVDGEDVYWAESRPSEGGRTAIVRRGPDGTTEDIGPPDLNARTSVHEYGGGAYAVDDGVVYAASFHDQRWYRIAPDAIPSPITPMPDSPAALRYADITIRGSWAIAVRESHNQEGSEPINDLVRIDLTGLVAPMRVASGHDFYAAPRISPDGTTLAWLTWDHPRMPWEGTELWVAPIDGNGEIGDQSLVAGGSDESVLQPEWSPDGVLHFASDRTGWWNLYRTIDGTVEAIHPDSAEYARAPWTFGVRRYGFLPDGRIVVAVEGTAGDRLRVIGDDVNEVPLAGAAVAGDLAIQDGSVLCGVSAFDRPTRLARIAVDSGEEAEVCSPPDPGFDSTYASIPEPVEFDTPDGPAYALFYPPTNPDVEAPPNTLPPAIVTIHGGPTGRITMSLNAERLFWTSRGFGVIDVDYGGSAGHGRAYRQRLEAEWGVVDVRDCALAAGHLADTGRVDPDRLVIAGGSAGGYTVLMAMAIHDVFAAGIARYPVTDLMSLAADTHKFESRYLDSMVGPLPETRSRYIERSPLTHVGRITAPVLLLQGSDDRVVPPSQPKAIRDALASNGIRVEYIEFEGEGHGFRSAEARLRTLESEWAFCMDVLGLA